MAIDIVRGSSKRPAASQELVNILSSQQWLAGHLFIGYPAIATPEGPHWIDALLVWENKGIVIFDLIDGKSAGNYGQRQDDSANKLEARLRVNSELMKGRSLRVPIHTISFMPGVTNVSPQANDGYPLANASSLVQELGNLVSDEWDHKKNKKVIDLTLSAIQSISTIRKSGARRTPRQENSRGHKLKTLEDSIATLDNRQSRAVVETVEGVQRIRGLAGSGKTIVLALKAAYLHVRHPEWRIAVTFNTRSLKGYFRRLIERFTLEQTGDEPDWDYLRIVNAWGARGGAERDGLYAEFCRAHEIRYLDYMSARNKFGRGEAFSGACKQALSQQRNNRKLYDAILVDEAQDLSPAFLRICYRMLGNSKRLVYAYDELQRLSGESLPSPEEIFGKDSDGVPHVRFESGSGAEPERDIILAKCYRNSRPVLVTAHALGFGIYRKAQEQNETGIVQMFDQPELWREIGYRVQRGTLREGSRVTLHRPAETSPGFLEDHSKIDDLIQFICFGSESEQTEWLSREIKKNVEHDELRHEDIIVINPDPLTTRSNVAPIRTRLLEMGINSLLAGVDDDPDIFFQIGKELITFSGVFRAKGNEAGMVYIINAQDCHSASRNLARIRNQLFTAITRSKAWVRVLGIGRGMEQLQEEYETLKKQAFELKFKYPDAEQRKQLRLVHRDMTQGERKRLWSRQQNLLDLIEDIESSKIHLEDLNPDAVAKLKQLLTHEGR